MYLVRPVHEHSPQKKQLLNLLRKDICMNISSEWVNWLNIVYINKIKIEVYEWVKIWIITKKLPPPPEWLLNLKNSKIPPTPTHKSSTHKLKWVTKVTKYSHSTCRSNHRRLRRWWPPISASRCPNTNQQSSITISRWQLPRPC